jgi:hypothetical protein
VVHPASSPWVGNPRQNLSQLGAGRDRVRHGRSDQMIGGSTDRG